MIWLSGEPVAKGLSKMLFVVPEVYGVEAPLPQRPRGFIWPFLAWILYGRPVDPLVQLSLVVIPIDLPATWCSHVGSQCDLQVQSARVDPTYLGGRKEVGSAYAVHQMAIPSSTVSMHKMPFLFQCDFQC